MKKYTNGSGKILLENEIPEGIVFERGVAYVEGIGYIEEIAPDWMINQLRRSVAHDLELWEDIPYEKAIAFLQRYGYFDNWTAYDINHRPIDIDAISESFAERSE